MCKECLQNYASNLISDSNHQGPLKCPCCPRLLRVEDAKVALDKQQNGGSRRRIKPSSVIKRASSSKRHATKEGGLFAEEHTNIKNNALEHLMKWDEKARDEFLRSMEDFRPCPHCSGEGDKGSSYEDDTDNTPTNNTSNKKGGGFVTGECLAPINEERETRAERLLKIAEASPRATVIAYLVYYLRRTTGTTSAAPSGYMSAILQIAMALAPSVLLPIVPHLVRYALAYTARREITRPILVTCPCCEIDFPLLASSELAGTSSYTASDSATEHWKNSNTRPCPGCSSPIMKDGGCNHVKCGKCRVDFCWACMRPRSRCQAYKCNNGAPYGNAFGDGSLLAVRAGLERLERERHVGQTLVERIDYNEALALRNLRLIRGDLILAALQNFGRLIQSSPAHYMAVIIGVVGLSLSCLNNPSHAVNSVLVVFSKAMSLVVENIALAILFIGRSFVYLSLRLICCASLYVLIVHWPLGGRQNPGARRGRQQNREFGLNQRLNNITPRRNTISFPRRPGLRIEEEQLTEAIARSLIEQ